MAIKINSTTVIDNNRKGIFKNCTTQTKTISQLASSSGSYTGEVIVCPEGKGGNGDIVVWNGSKWVSGNVLATGGTVNIYNGRAYHIFTSPGTFKCFGDSSLNVVAIGGGGGAGFQGGGGGGAGQVIQTAIDGSYFTSGNSYSCSVTVGALGLGGGPGRQDAGLNGGTSSLNFSGVKSTISAVGGGGGGHLISPAGQLAQTGSPGASGGGGGAAYRQWRAGGSATTPQGNSGGRGTYSYDNYFSGGGGGSSQGAGSFGPGTYGGMGGAAIGLEGLTPAVGTPGPDPSMRYFAGGGWGTSWSGSRPRPSYGGAGGSTGSGNVFPSPQMAPQIPETNALPNTGSGGGGTSWSWPALPPGGNGAAGIVIISYGV